MAHYKTKGFETPEGDTYDIIPPMAEANMLGGITASAITSQDADYDLEVKINTTSGRAYVSSATSKAVESLGLSVNSEGYLCITVTTEDT